MRKDIYRQDRERKKHSRWHDKERERMKEYRCLICDKVYTVRTSYLKHMKKEHGEKIPYLVSSRILNAACAFQKTKSK
ncbi:hypothetical protein KUTeg_023472 [Tegillarca granosa]|uniref:C2H2-type domain-containing protein n=1 Tax=Tegillarca granosa TaxID=220873 RepID=A0ABQ9E791_TEGGR|nr:hypothetical protein KUTeg_023472 [Tegillarca granosa]